MPNKFQSKHSTPQEIPQTPIKTQPTLAEKLYHQVCLCAPYVVFMAYVLAAQS